MGRALVLSGGGAVGIAWETGLAAGLSAAGISLADADLIIGTSAGSSVGARLALRHDLHEAMARYREEEPQRTSSAASSGSWLPELMRVMAEAQQASTPEEGRRLIGEFALAADAPPEESFVAGFASYLAGATWPEHYRCTAIDAASGDFVVWSAESGAPMERAVASSCAVPGVFPPITINGRRYIDGGMRSSTNADLAAGHETVLIVAFSSASAGSTDPRAVRLRQRMENEQRALRDAGATTIEVINPDDDTKAVMGVNPLDPRVTPAVAEAGVRQGAALADSLAAIWR